MRFSSNSIPDHILKLMPKEDRPAGVIGMTRTEINEVQETKSEKELQNLIQNYLGLRGIFAGRQRMDKRSNLVIGWPDVFFSYKGIPIALECKVGAGKQTQEQKEAQVKMEANGWRYFEVRSLQEVKIILDVFSSDISQKDGASL